MSATKSLEVCNGSGMVSGKKVANKKEHRKTVELKYSEGTFMKPVLKSPDLLYLY